MNDQETPVVEETPSESMPVDEAPPEDVETPMVEQAEPVEVSPDEPSSPAPEFNCPSCGGEGLQDQFTVCPTCSGTGKVA